MAIGSPNVPPEYYPRGFLSVTKAGRIILVDPESELDDTGVRIEGRFVSSSLNKTLDPLSEIRLQGIGFQYSAPAIALVGIDLSPDGGVTWSFQDDVSFPATGGNSLGFYKHWRELVGKEIIFRLRLFSNEVVSIYKYFPFAMKSRSIFR